MHMVDNRSLCCYSTWPGFLFIVLFNNFAWSVGFYGVTCSYSSHLLLCTLVATSASDGVQNEVSHADINTTGGKYMYTPQQLIPSSSLLPWNFILFWVPSFIVAAIGHHGWCNIKSRATCNKGSSNSWMVNFVGRKFVSGHRVWKLEPHENISVQYTNEMNHS